MGRGGRREKAGRRSGWKHSETQTIRVPKVFATQLLEHARRLDSGEDLELIQAAPECNPIVEVVPVIDFVSESITGIDVAPGQIRLFEFCDSDTKSKISVFDIETKSKVPPRSSDGKMWLTSPQAYEVAQLRGYPSKYNTFREFAREKPEECLRLYSLRRLSNISPARGVPVFEDMDCPEF
jgi:hypothetical protein